MGYPHLPTPIKTDNTTALGVVTNTIKRKRTKAMDMRSHWLTDRQNQNTITNILGTRKRQQGRLLHKTFPTYPP